MWAIEADQIVSPRCCAKCGRPFAGREQHGVTLDLNAVTFRGQSARLELRESELLSVLLEATPAFVRRERLYMRVWADQTESSRVLDVYIHKLRKKIQPLGLVIGTARGIGYKLVLPVGK